jgi:chromosome segregation ATPase
MVDAAAMLERALQRLERQAREKQSTIQKLCQKLSLFSLLELLQGVRPNDMITAVQDLYAVITQTKDGPSEAVVSQVAALEAALETKRGRYRELEAKLQAYLAQAEEGDHEFDRHAAEKMAIIAGFREARSGSGLALSQLETEYGQLRQENQEGRAQCVAARDQLKASHSRTKQLDRELKQLQSQLGAAEERKDQARSQIKTNQLIIEEKRGELRRLKGQIRTLRQNNQLLENLLEGDA